jgi:hypothetical protein
MKNDSRLNGGFWFGVSLIFFGLSLVFGNVTFLVISIAFSATYFWINGAIAEVDWWEKKE